MVILDEEASKYSDRDLLIDIHSTQDKIWKTLLIILGAIVGGNVFTKFGSPPILEISIWFIIVASIYSIGYVLFFRPEQRRLLVALNVCIVAINSAVVSAIEQEEVAKLISNELMVILLSLFVILFSILWIYYQWRLPTSRLKPVMK